MRLRSVRLGTHKVTQLIQPSSAPQGTEVYCTTFTGPCDQYVSGAAFLVRLCSTISSSCVP